MASYEVHMHSPNEAEQVPPVEIFDVDLGFNQVGYLCFTNNQRETIALFNPMFVRFVGLIDHDHISETVDESPKPEEIN